MQKAKHIVMVAGEESGDIHAAALVRQLKEAYPDIIISGIGGQHMKREGVELVSDLARHGVTGLYEVVRLFNVIRKAFTAIKKHLNQQKPDLLILVDYPGFNLRLAKYAKQKLGIKILYYISPQIWAWKANRIHLIKQTVDKMAVILPFEKKLYEQAGVPVAFVGHPLVEKIPSDPNPEIYRKELNLPLQARIIALLPGSRNNEIEKHLPILKETAVLLHQQDPDTHFIIPIAETINSDKIKSYFANLDLPLTVFKAKALDCMSAADFVIVASGTASLECALLEKPMCIIYKSSFITYYAVMKLLKVRFLGLSNLLMDRFITPEFLQYDCNPIELARYINYFHHDPLQPQKMKKQLAQVKQSLSPQQADCSLFELVVTELAEKKT